MNFSQLDFSHPHIMGVLNITPDSFSDGGCFNTPELALRQAERMLQEGASIIDVGGESTRPGAKSVETQKELDRVIPVIEAIVKNLDIVVSIDTSKATVMQEAVQAGASLINDVNALRSDHALQTAIALKTPVCLVHMQGEPHTMQEKPQYKDVVDEVCLFLLKRAELLQQSGFSMSNIILDPGFGFGKTLTHNLALLRHLTSLTHIGYPVLVGLSRKSILGAITGREIDQRLSASLAVAFQALQSGVRILRVHDVAPTLDVIKVWAAIH